MNKAFEKILEMLEVLIEKSYYEATEGSHNAGIRNSAYHKVKKIVQKVAEEYNNGWVPCSERLPESGVHVLCYGKNSLGSFKYEVSVYAEEIECWMCSKIADVIAWQPLPEAYKDN